LGQERKQEAQLPQRNSTSAEHVYLGWLTDRAMHRTPQNRRSLHRWLHPGNDPLSQISCKSVHGTLLAKWVKYNEYFIYLYVYTFFGDSTTGQTPRWIFTRNGSNNAVSGKDVPFRGLENW